MGNMTVYSMEEKKDKENKTHYHMDINQEKGLVAKQVLWPKQGRRRSK